jgi:3-hydroxypropanoate dehydrogenase
VHAERRQGDLLRIVRKWHDALGAFAQSSTPSGGVTRAPQRTVAPVRRDPGDSRRIFPVMNAQVLPALAAVPSSDAPRSPAQDTVARLFLEARTHGAFLDQPVDDALLRRIYEAARMGPTAANSVPMRIVFVKSSAAKERLRPTLSPGNVDKTMKAPVTAIIAYDENFADKMPQLFPARPGMRESLASMPVDKRDFMLLQNASLQAGYFILAARAHGLDAGPMGGFDRAAVDAAFLGGSPWKSVLLVNLGYGDRSALHPRLPRLSFEEACRVE